MSNKNGKDNKNNQLNWLIKIFFTTFFLSITFNYASSQLIEELNVIPSILILLLIILIGIFSDMLATAVTAADEAPFHAKAADKKKGAKQSVKLVKNADKVSNFCGDVIGDICGVLSGAVSTLISISIAKELGLNDITLISMVTTGLVASLTVLGKGIGKKIGINKANKIINTLGIFIDFISFKHK
jgi:CBS domain containing-hemolysin-like protein